MDLAERIVERENKFLAEVLELTEAGKPIYIYGAGFGGRQVCSRLQTRHVLIEGMVEDAGCREHECDASCLEDVLDQAKDKVCLIVAFRGFSADKLAPYRGKIDRVIDRDCWAGNYAVDSSYVTYEWVEEHMDRLQGVYEKLCDEKSKETFAAYLNQKISMDFKYLKKTKSRNQYFEDDIVKLSDHEVFADCGAYDGDSAAAFIAALGRNGRTSYDEIISFEPDFENYKKLCQRNFRNHRCICKGVSDTPGSVTFSMNGTLGMILDAENAGNAVIELDTLDHVLGGGGGLTMLKMDIEGAELSALAGARESIRKWKPKLAICIYHKKEDLWEIAEYILGIEPEYRLYMRNYEDTATELVLYAVMPQDL